MLISAPMKMRLIIILTGLLTLASCSDELAGNRPYILTTATTGGAYYPIGVAIATITKSQLGPEGIALSAISSAGSLENIKLLRDNQAQFALLQGPFAAWGWNGEGPISRPQTGLRSVAAVWLNVEHFVITNDLVETGTIRDLDNLSGQRFVLGARNSGAEQTGRYILESLGINYEEKMSLAWMGYGGAANAIQDGNVVGMNVPAGAPVSAITQAFAQMGDELTLLNFTEQDLIDINRRYDLWDWYEFPADTYPNQSEPVRSIASPNVLAARSDVPEEVVYQITKTIWENLSALQEIHAATKDMQLQRAVRGLGAPLHPGAIRYYRERGLEIPERLIMPGEDRPAGIDDL
ncbi:TAXI family TRAP transporter solute-binding subunit [Pseudohongiella sp. SYSU M77423]|uniref:TAXI family TRAP transporter solute-binding subunit n=1 Tax=unclassified Pseudohongiella TaxID=2629611 RepID=UPI001F1B1BEF|nr:MULTISPECIES: TAXI family TRAP transporter solute-binding subunit [unclassified Pseudohongiella]MDH7942263.1 TAXI family TRAP transporter solute-binding subunit [Pseudohongiella sp. SYSU M77423]